MSTTFALTDIYDQFKNNLDDGKITCGVFINLPKAFILFLFYFIYNTMVPTSTPRHSNKRGETRYTARKCNKKCLKQLYILVNEKQ